jgi:hypothetical protein
VRSVEASWKQIRVGAIDDNDVFNVSVVLADAGVQLHEPAKAFRT